MPQRSKIELQGLVDKVVYMYINQGKRQQDIAEELSKQGFQISKGGVNRVIKNHAKQLKDLKEKQNWAESLIAATNKTPRLSIADAGLQIASMKLLEDISEMGIEDMQEIDTEKKIALLTKVSRAIGLAANVELNFERGRKQGLLDAGKKLEEVQKKLDISDEKMAYIRAEVFGLKK